MSTREIAVQLLNEVPESKMMYVISFLQGVIIPDDTEIPNEETLQAIAEGEEMLKNPSKYKGYSSFDELMEDVLNDV
jgi:hypothetical protein